MFEVNLLADPGIQPEIVDASISFRPETNAEPQEAEAVLESDYSEVPVPAEIPVESPETTFEKPEIAAAEPELVIDEPVYELPEKDPVSGMGPKETVSENVVPPVLTKQASQSLFSRFKIIGLAVLGIAAAVFSWWVIPDFLQMKMENPIIGSPQPIPAIVSQMNDVLGSIPSAVQLNSFSIDREISALNFAASRQTVLAPVCEAFESALSVPCRFYGSEEEGYHLEVLVPVQESEIPPMNLTVVKEIIEPYNTGGFYEFSGEKSGLYTALEYEQMVPMLKALLNADVLTGYHIKIRYSSNNQYIIELTTSQNSTP